MVRFRSTHTQRERSHLADHKLMQLRDRGEGASTAEPLRGFSLTLTIKSLLL